MIDFLAASTGIVHWSKETRGRSWETPPLQYHHRYRRRASATPAAMLIDAIAPSGSRFVGIAGPKMEAAGCEAWHPLEALSVAGITEVISRLPAILSIRRALVRRLRAERVPMFIGVDAPDFNLGLERKLKRRGVRTIHFVSPAVWAWRRKRVVTIGRSVHRILTLFPFEAPIYEAAGVPVTFVGHPLAQEAAILASKREARDQLGLGIAQPVFALLPGSRMGELEKHGDLVLQTAAALHAARPEARFLVPLATRSTRDWFDAARYRLGLDKLPMTFMVTHRWCAARGGRRRYHIRKATLEAPSPAARTDLLPRERGDGANGPPAAARPLGWTAQRACR
jgi:lipid A disaccharide synthetase